MRYPPRVVLTLGLLAALKAAALVGIAEAVARGIVSVIAASDDWRDAVALGLAAGLLRALTTWGAQYYATRASIGAKERLRHELAERALDGGGGSVGSLTAIGTTGLDELDGYYRTALPAIVTAATVPLLIGTRILFADWVSALIVVLTVPLVPVFMVLVGLHSKEKADEASATLQRLSNHLVELARGLPVLVGLGRVQEQSEALRAVSEKHRATTMATLRTAFLSSLVLELIATISVAVVAVFVGLRLVNGDLPLVVGLVALILAPECFAPFRELGSAFHASQDGLAAMRAAKEVTDAPRVPSIRTAGPTVRIENLRVQYADRDAAAIAGLDLVIDRGSITSLEGPSGAGKSTVLAALAGVILPADGRIFGVDPARVAWVPQHPRTVGATVHDELALYGDDVDDVIARLGLGGVADVDPARLSPGELRRLAVARGLVRVAAGAELLLLDEPTAHLDPAHARQVEDAIEALRGRVTIVMASHEAGVARLADRRVLLGASGGMREVDEDTALESSRFSDDAELPSSGALRELVAFLRPSIGRTLAAVGVGTGAALFAVALTAVSGWLIVRASEQPPIMYLMVAIVGVRFFGIGRAALRYAERLLTHDAVLGSVTGLRVRLWAGLARRGTQARSFATGGTALDYLMSASDRVRDLVPRVILPPAVAVGTGVASIIAVAALHSPALPVIVAMLVVSIVVAPTVATLVDRSAARELGTVRSLVLARFTGLVAAAGDLRGNGRGAAVLRNLDELDARAGRLARSTAGALGLGQAVVVLAGTGAAALMLPATADAVVAGTLPGAVVAVLVLLPLALIDPLVGLVDAVVQWPALSAALRRIGSITASAPAADAVPTGRITRLELHDVTAGWPGSSTSFGAVSASAGRGDWIVVEGPSGSGKSTLLATLLGFVPAASGTIVFDRDDSAPSTAQRIAWAPQEAHLFDSTIRGNLLLARERDDRPTDSDLIAALETAGLGDLLATLPLGLDTPVGSGGDRLSGGERQRLAVARTLLTRADLVLLDEPTAHLDAASADRLMASLRAALSDRIVVLVSHHADEIRVGDARVGFGSRALNPVAG